MVNGRGERNLIAAVIEQTLQDVMGEQVGDVPLKDRAKVQRSASRWILGNRDGLFSFRYCCEALDMDPGRIRKRVREGRINFWSLKVEDNDGS